MLEIIDSFDNCKDAENFLGWETVGEFDTPKFGINTLLFKLLKSTLKSGINISDYEEIF